MCWHKYGKWSKAIESYGGSLYQACECVKCGSIKYRLAVSIFKAQLRPDQVNLAVASTREGEQQ